MIFCLEILELTSIRKTVIILNFDPLISSKLTVLTFTKTNPLRNEKFSLQTKPSSHICDRLAAFHCCTYGWVAIQLNHSFFHCLFLGSKKLNYLLRWMLKFSAQTFCRGGNFIWTVAFLFPFATNKLPLKYHFHLSKVYHEDETK